MPPATPPDDPRAAIPADLRERVLERLGLTSRLEPDLDGLRAVYRAWCDAIPFDNVRKMIALRSGSLQALPGADPRDFFEAWLAHGAGGTCWPTNGAMFALVSGLGFDARRVGCSMQDTGRVNHGSTIVRLDGQDWLADSSMLTNVPLPLGDGIFVFDDGVCAAEVEPTDGAHVVWTYSIANQRHLPCRLLLDGMSHEASLEAYEASRAESPFNRRLYARRNHGHELRALVGPERVCRRADGVTRRRLSRDDVLGALRSDVGLSEELVGTWVASGSLEASFAPAPEPPTTPKPSGRPLLPPSLR